jgi:hypothetical protein
MLGQEKNATETADKCSINIYKSVCWKKILNPRPFMVCDYHRAFKTNAIEAEIETAHSRLPIWTVGNRANYV